MKVGVVFGGKSVEHEISILTGLRLMKDMDKDKYDIVAIYITKEGKWLTGESLKNLETYKEKNFKNVEEFFFSATNGDSNMYANPNKRKFFGKKVLNKVDIIFNALHGNYGEDGSIQGLFEMMNIPYVGSGVLSSGISTDKIVLKDIYKANGLPVVNYYWFYRRAWNMGNKRALLEDLEKDLAYPMIVKPAGLGSSIGISHVKERQELEEAIDLAKKYDRKIIVEEAIENARDISCLVIGKDEELEVSDCEEIVGWSGIVDFEDKYLNIYSNNLDKENQIRRILPARITENIRNKIETLAKRAFTSIDASGIAKVDFLMDDMHNIYVSEINTLPWSVGFNIWEDMGKSKDRLISDLIKIAIQKNKEKNKNIYTIDSNLLFKIDLKDDED